MAAKYILAAFSALLLAFAFARIFRDGGRVQSAARTWLIIAITFAVVSTWLWMST
jgi:hypothetical protein